MGLSAAQIEAIRSATLAQMEALLALSGPTVTVGDAAVAWMPWLAHLQANVDWCDAKLAECEPYEVRSRG